MFVNVCSVLKKSRCCLPTFFLRPLVEGVCAILRTLLGQGRLLIPLDDGQVLGEAVLSVLLVLLLLYLLLTELASGEHGLPNLVATQPTAAAGDNKN